MTPLSHNQYIKLFSDIATAHRSINSYHVGDLDNYTANESDALNPVTLWVIVNDDTIEGKVDKPKYSFVVLDYVNQDSSNLDEVLSDTLRISKDVVAMLRQPYYETFFKLEESVTFNPFNEKFDSDVAGWQFDLIFNQSFLYDACEVNTTGLPTINYETISINTSNSTWGYIVGTLSNQTDLQNALNAKPDTLAEVLTNGYNTGGNPIRANDGDPIYIGTDESRYIYYNSLSATPGLFLVNNNSNEFLNLRDAGGLDVNGTTVSMAELGRVSGVTSNIQTQLNAKQSYLHFQFGWSVQNPADNTTYFLSSANLFNGNVAGHSRIVLPVACTFIGYSFNNINLSSNASNETSTLRIRKNNTTNTDLNTGILFNATSLVSDFTKSISFSAGDDFSAQLLTATWATNPFSSCMNIVFYFRID